MYKSFGTLFLGIFLLSCNKQVELISNQNNSILSSPNNSSEHINMVEENAIPKGLLVYLPFNGNANDASGNTNNGTVFGAQLTSDRFGKPNSAYSFTTNNYGLGQLADQIYLNYNPSFNSTNFSIALWLNPNTYYWSANNNPPMSILLNRFEGGYSNPNSQCWALDLSNDQVLGGILEPSSSNAQRNSIVLSQTWKIHAN